MRGALNRDQASFRGSASLAPRKAGRAGFLYTLGGNCAYAMGQWAMLLFLNKWGGVEAAGAFLISQAIVQPASLLLYFNSRVVYLTSPEAKLEFLDYLGARFVWSLLLIPIAAITSIAIRHGSVGHLSLVVAMAASAVPLGMGDIYAGHFQRARQLGLAGASLAAKGLLGALFGAVFFIAFGSVVSAVVGTAVARAFAYLVMDVGMASGIVYSCSRVGVAKRVFGVLSLRKAACVAWVGMPLGMTAVLGALSPQLPRLILDRYEGVQSVGVFGSIAQLVMLGSMIVTAVGAVLMPRLAELGSSARRYDFWALSARGATAAFTVGSLGLLVGWSIGERGLVWIFNDQFRGSGSLLTIMLFGATIQYVGNALTVIVASARFYRTVFVGAVMQCLCVAVAGWLLIPVYGMLGAALSLVVGNAVHLLVCMVGLVLVDVDIRGRVGCAVAAS